MKKLLPFLPVLFTLLFYSCEKEKTTIENDVIRTLTINETTHTYVNDDNRRYVENTLVSQQDQHVYKLAMTKGIQYRISVTQPNTSMVQAKMTLVNIKQDTLSESLNESPYKSLIVITSPETANYYLIINLQKRTNPEFNYRLYFEEVTDDAMSFLGLNWSVNGPWNVSNSNSIELANTGSNIYRHLNLVSPLTGNPSISFLIQNSSNNYISFGFMLSASGDYLWYGDWAYELQSSGYAFLAFPVNLNCALMTLTAGNTYYDWVPLGAINMNFLTGLKVDIKYESGGYYIYLNDIRLSYIKGNLQNLHILLEDRGNATTSIKNLQINN